MRGGIVVVFLILALLCPQGIMAAETGTEVGQTAPDFVLRDVDGKVHRLSDYRGKIVMIYFAMWCGVCRSNCHEIQEVFYKRYHKKGVELFALDYLQNGDRELSPIVKDLGLRYKTLMDDGTMMKSYNGTMALTLLIDRQGVIRFRDFYNKTKVETVVKELLGKKKPLSERKAEVKAPKKGIVRQDRSMRRAFRETVLYGGQKAGGRGYFIQSRSLDLNGDGYGDIAYGDPFAGEGRGAVLIHYGGRNGIAEKPDLVLTGEEPGDFFGYSVNGGDLNRDGITDLIVGAVQWRNKKPGAMYLFPGSGDGLSQKPMTVLRGLSQEEWFGFRTAAGDINGDGLPDLVVSGHLNSKREKEAGAVSLFYGTRMGYGEKPDLVITGEEALDNLGASLECLDMDGDGIDDLIAGAPGSNGEGVDTGAVYVFYGKKGGLSATSVKEADWVFSGERSMDNLGSSLAPAGDLNGDGRTDLALGTCNVKPEERGRVYIFTGGKRLTRPDRVIRAGKDEPMFGCSLSGLGDLDRKGRTALAIGSEAGRGGAVHIFLSGKDRPSMVIYGSSEKGKFGTTVQNVGDVNGDGRPDILIGEPWNSERAERGGAVHLLY